MSLLSKNKKTGFYTDVVDVNGHMISRMKNLHDPALCAERGCAIHAHPSSHPLMDAPLLWRDDRGILERVCEHGIGHPDHDSALFLESIGQGYQNIHGCDKCCQDASGDVSPEELVDEETIQNSPLLATDVPTLLTPEQKYYEWRIKQSDNAFKPSLKDAWFAAWAAASQNDNV